MSTVVSAPLSQTSVALADDPARRTKNSWMQQFHDASWPTFGQSRSRWPSGVIAAGICDDADRFWEEGWGANPVARAYACSYWRRTATPADMDCVLLRLLDHERGRLTSCPDVQLPDEEVLASAMRDMQVSLVSMKLNSELALGEQSFHCGTEISLDGGLCIMVGPNGGGKSVLLSFVAAKIEQLTKTKTADAELASAELVFALDDDAQCVIRSALHYCANEFDMGEGVLSEEYIRSFERRRADLLNADRAWSMSLLDGQLTLHSTSTVATATVPPDFSDAVTIPLDGSPLRKEFGLAPDHLCKELLMEDVPPEQRSLDVDIGGAASLREWLHNRVLEQVRFVDQDRGVDYSEPSTSFSSSSCCVRPADVYAGLTDVATSLPGHFRKDAHAKFIEAFHMFTGFRVQVQVASPDRVLRFLSENRRWYPALWSRLKDFVFDLVPQERDLASLAAAMHHRTTVDPALSALLSEKLIKMEPELAAELSWSAETTAGRHLPDVSFWFGNVQVPSARLPGYAKSLLLTLFAAHFGNIVLIDEPEQNLRQEVAARLVEHLGHLAAVASRSIVFVTHEPGMLTQLNSVFYIRGLCAIRVLPRIAELEADAARLRLVADEAQRLTRSQPTSEPAVAGGLFDDSDDMLFDFGEMSTLDHAAASATQRASEARCVANDATDRLHDAQTRQVLLNKVCVSLARRQLMFASSAILVEGINDMRLMEALQQAARERLVEARSRDAAQIERNGVLSLDMLTRFGSASVIEMGSCLSTDLVRMAALIKLPTWTVYDGDVLFRTIEKEATCGRVAETATKTRQSVANKEKIFDGWDSAVLATPFKKIYGGVRPPGVRDKAVIRRWLRDFHIFTWPELEMEYSLGESKTVVNVIAKQFNKDDQAAREFINDESGLHDNWGALRPEHILSMARGLLVESNTVQELVRLVGTQQKT